MLKKYSFNLKLTRVFTSYCKIFARYTGNYCTRTAL